MIGHFMGFPTLSVPVGNGEGEIVGNNCREEDVLDGMNSGYRGSCGDPRGDGLLDGWSPPWLPISGFQFP